MESRGTEDSKNVKTSQAYFFEGFISFFEDFSLTKAANDNRRVKQTMLRYFKRVVIFRDKHYTNRRVREALRICLFSISQYLEKDMFSIEMDPRMQFRSIKGLEKHWLLKFH